MPSLALLISICIVLMTEVCAKQGKLHDNVKYRAKYLREHDALFKLRRADCASNQFSCPEGCIRESYVCDTIDDCANGYDEQNCSTDCSGPNQFKCTNGHCIPIAYHCDKDNDCGDGSDESDCGYTCPQDSFTCNNGNCVDNMWICDGDNDCWDYSDEQNCTERTCSAYQFTCGNNICIPSSYECDGYQDCNDNSDERLCTCDSDHFKCAKGECLPLTYKCDGENDCGDMSDESDCAELHPGACIDLLTFEDCLRMNITTYPICDNYADGHRLCRKFCGLCNA